MTGILELVITVIMRLTFDDTYEMNYISFAGPVNDSINNNGISCAVKMKVVKEVDASIRCFQKKTDDNGKNLFYLMLILRNHNKN